ncbi:hypothetical protein [Mesorhizobium sp. 2RAF21]|uniref:hypothetical protein n=1 Tax=Mesorhizobium sp. 2RAF21 TaxID=3232995 RepID=UPI003F992BC1
MVTWQQAEDTVKRAVRHFTAVARIANPDSYTTEMAQRHAIECGCREFVDAFGLLQRLHPKGAGISLFSEEVRRAYMTMRPLEVEELTTPSDIDPMTLADAVAAAGVMAERLQEDFQRIRKEIGDV